MDEAFATPALAKLAAEEKNPGREAAFWVLRSQATPTAVLALRQVPPTGMNAAVQQVLASPFASLPVLLTPRHPPRILRQRFLDAFHAIVDHSQWELFDALTSDDSDYEVDAVAVLTPEDLPLIRMVRRHCLARGHEEAIPDYDRFTGILMTMIWLPEWPKPSPHNGPAPPAPRSKP